MTSRTSHERYLAGTVEIEPGRRAGKDPRELSVEQLESLGHLPISPMRAIRAKCMDCSEGQNSELTNCTVVSCALWPFRMRHNPYRKPMSDEARAAVSERLRNIRPGARSGDDSDEE